MISTNYVTFYCTRCTLKIISNKDKDNLPTDEIPCVGYTDFDGVTWKTTSVNSYDYQTCGTGKGSTSYELS